MKDLSQFSTVYLIPLSDLHEGARDADHEESDGYINWIKTHDNAFTLFNGDMMNCAWKDSTPELFEDLITPDKADDDTGVDEIGELGHEMNLDDFRPAEFLGTGEYDDYLTPIRPLTPPTTTKDKYEDVRIEGGLPGDLPNFPDLPQ